MKRYLLHPYRTIKVLQDANGRQADMIHDATTTGKNRMNEIRRLRDEVACLKILLANLKDAYADSEQCNDDLAEENWCLRHEVLTYADGLHQGRFDAWTGNLPPCPHCGAGEAWPRHNRQPDGGLCEYDPDRHAG